MLTEQRKLAVLAALLAVLGVIGYRALTSPAPTLPVTGSTQPAARSGSETPLVEPPDVRLEALGTDRPSPQDAHRNLFQFGARFASVPTPRTPGPSPSPPPPQPPQPRPTPTMTPIALKFIGVVEAPDRALRLAILSDGRGIYHGKEGDVVEGRYRIVKIGAESVEMTHLDGSGTQTIRLSGS